MRNLCQPREMGIFFGKKSGKGAQENFTYISNVGLGTSRAWFYSQECWDLLLVMAQALSRIQP